MMGTTVRAKGQILESETRLIPLYSQSCSSSFLYHPFCLTMSIAYANVAACAKRIVELVGTCAETDPKLTLSGRSPSFPVIALQTLLPRLAYERLDLSKRGRVSDVLARCLTSLQDRFTRQFWREIESLYSPRNTGMSDAEVEAGLVRMYETRYDRCLEDVRALLSRLLSSERAQIDTRNTRGGFGDVSPPLLTPS